MERTLGLDLGNKRKTTTYSVTRVRPSSPTTISLPLPVPVPISLQLPSLPSPLQSSSYSLGIVASGHDPHSNGSASSVTATATATSTPTPPSILSMSRSRSRRNNNNHISVAELAHRFLEENVRNCIKPRIFPMEITSGTERVPTPLPFGYASDIYLRGRRQVFTMALATKEFPKSHNTNSNSNANSNWNNNSNNVGNCIDEVFDRRTVTVAHSSNCSGTRGAGADPRRGQHGNGPLQN